MTEWMDRDAEGAEPVKRSRYFENDGTTIESPGMVRWYSKPCHYFLKRIGNMASGVTKPHTFVLGLEHRMGDGAYAFNTSIEFDNHEAPDLMDRIAEFNDLPKYTDLLKTREAVEHIIERLNGPMYSSGVFKGAILRELRMALKGEQVDG